MSHRLTPQLEVVYRAVDCVRDHPTARRVLERAREELPQISLSTVYRNLDKLTRCGRIRMIRLETGVAIYDALTEAHDHFVCEECGEISDVMAEGVARLDARLPGHIVQRRSALLYGKCGACNEPEH